MEGPGDAVRVRKILLRIRGVSSVQVDVVRGSIFLLATGDLDLRKVRESLARSGFRAPARED